MKTFLSLLLSPLLYFSSQGQSSEEEISRTLRFTRSDAPPTLVLKNINGRVHIIGDEGKEVRLTARKTIRADHRKHLARAREEVQLVAEVERNVAWVYLKAPYIQAERRDDDLHYRVHRKDDDYSVRFDFTVRVPRDTRLRVSTINEGEVTVAHMQSSLVEVSNVNGPVRGTDLRGTTYARTVNGEIDLHYTAPPTEACRYQTVNGNIYLHFPKNLSAEVRFRSRNGDLLTDFPTLEYLPAQVTTDRRPSGSRTTYRVDQTTRIRIGEGGPLLDTEVLNGSVYLRQQ